MEVELSAVPPGFRFHPTEEELVGYYLRRKVNSEKIDLDIITHIDLYRIEPWDIQDRCKQGNEEKNEWYFFSHKDKKYPTGTRTNRATTAGFWKATGRDKAVLSKQSIIGMRKTLVFYKGRAPNGKKTDWIMHEYRLQSSEHGPPQEEGWVVCRAFKKPTPSHKQGYQAWHHTYNLIKPAYNLTGFQSFNDIASSSSIQGVNFHQQYFSCDQELGSKNTHLDDHHQIMELPQLDSPSFSTSLATNKEGFDPNHNNIDQSSLDHDQKINYGGGEFVDWKNVDRLLLTSQLTETRVSPNADLSVMQQNYDENTHGSDDFFLNL